jgi:hypothetical protein
VLGGNQAGKHAPRYDADIMIAAAKGLAPAFDDAKPPLPATIDRSQGVEMDDAVGIAVHGAMVLSVVRSSSMITVD